MRMLGTVKEIWRYPVKGMGGEKAESVQVGEGGLDGDRQWALRDLLRDEIQSCKFRPELLKCTATSNQSSSIPWVELPDREVLPCNDPLIHERLSMLVGHASQLEPLQPGSPPERFRRYKGGAAGWFEELKATFDREEGEPLPDLEHLPQSIADFVTMPGTFFLVAPIHIVTTATLERLAALQPDADWDVRRFRPNLVIQTAADLDGTPEQEWLGQTLRLGNVRLECTAPAPRCGAITREQRDFRADSRVLRTVVKHSGQNAGIYGRAVQPGVLEAGDEVWLE